MPQLVKGGKHVFGWSRVGDDGHIIVPPEALVEYRLTEPEKLVLMPGSRTSGGFGVASMESLRSSALGAALKLHPSLRPLRMPEGEPIEYKGKTYCRVGLRGGGVTVPLGTLSRYGVNTGDRLLVVRGSGLAVGFAVRGPIVEEAKRHSELKVFGP
ncbi:MAG: hypothetical protein JW753_08270 [Dehalococcoidia bacterium]|nr:hypothetical protein [Dehalococcoidia bacterium]